jgi:5'-3' exonuclease
MCSDICKRGLVDAVLSEDTDVLAYGADVFLTKIDTYRNTCVQINYDQVLSSLNLNENEFLDLCIMCGTDYNKNIPKIGCETSYKYILKYRSIEQIKNNLPHIDISILNHSRTRELFIDYEKYSTINIPYCGKPDLYFQRS